jgi:choline dehydrogenase
VGISVIKDLKGVGKNLQDHLLTSVIFKAKKEIPAPEANLLEAQLFWKSKEEMVFPDLQPLFMGLPYYSPGLPVLKMHLHSVPDLFGLPAKDILN